MRFKLIPSELQTLQEIGKAYNEFAPRPNEVLGEVVPIRGGEDISDFFYSCFNRIFNKYVRTNNEIGLYRFRHVQMHTDDLYRPCELAAIMAVKGQGLLSYFNRDSDTIHNTELVIGKLVIFDDRKPHSFILDTEVGNCCFAIISSVNESFLRNIKPDTAYSN